MSAFRGVAPMTMVRCDGGTAVTVLAGLLVPSNAEADDVKRLESEGFIEKVSDEAQSGGMVSDTPDAPAFGEPGADEKPTAKKTAAAKPTE